jgi:hypothetical protein
MTTGSPVDWHASIVVLANDRSWRRPFITVLACASFVALVVVAVGERVVSWVLRAINQGHDR